jgi:hypothetical protein
MSTFGQPMSALGGIRRAMEARARLLNDVKLRENRQRFNLQGDKRSIQDTGYTPMFLSGGIQRDMGSQSIMPRPISGYDLYSSGISSKLGYFGAPAPVGFSGFGGGVQGKINYGIEQQGPWSGFSAQPNYGNRGEAPNPEPFIQSNMKFNGRFAAIAPALNPWMGQQNSAIRQNVMPFSR